MTTYPLDTISQFMHRLILSQPLFVLLIGLPGVLSATPGQSNPTPAVVFVVFFMIVTIISIVWYRALIHTIVLTDDDRIILRRISGEIIISIQMVTVFQRSFPNRHIVMQTAGDDFILSYKTNLFEFSYEGIDSLIREIIRRNPHVEVNGIFD